MTARVPKTNFNSQWGLVSETGGDAVPTTPVAADDGDGVPPLVDAFGRPFVNLVGGGPSGTAAPATGPPTNILRLQSINIALLQVPAPITLWSLYAASPADDAFFMVFDQNVAPIVGTIPTYVFQVMKEDYILESFAGIGGIMPSGTNAWFGWSGTYETYDASPPGIAGEYRRRILYSSP